MSVSYRVQDQVLRVDDRSEAVEAKVHRFDAFLNLLCAGRYAFQRDAVRDVWRFLVSEKHADTERLIRENWHARPEIARRLEQGLEAHLNRVPLRAKKQVPVSRRLHRILRRRSQRDIPGVAVGPHGATRGSRQPRVAQ